MFLIFCTLLMYILKISSYWKWFLEKELYFKKFWELYCIYPIILFINFPSGAKYLINFKPFYGSDLRAGIKYEINILVLKELRGRSYLLINALNRFREYFVKNNLG